ncbi:hypothetical protein RBWH47_03110 [Rhodopirellula baltica WH47]|uniref:Uncharacterized protein n=1 Tax=Rhodopirellula baltica WH47 TaxID=991778 RepID=F2AZZ0_RHOBT|nr:hypothetical protein RBWH47_03110 [Rhodopirellula baltica WH47]
MQRFRRSQPIHSDGTGNVSAVALAIEAKNQSELRFLLAGESAEIGTATRPEISSEIASIFAKRSRAPGLRVRSTPPKPTPEDKS